MFAYGNLFHYSNYSFICVQCKWENVRYKLEVWDRIPHRNEKQGNTQHGTLIRLGVKFEAPITTGVNGIDINRKMCMWLSKRKRFK